METQNTKLETALDEVAEKIETAGEDNSQILSDISSNILKNADNLQQFGSDANTGLTSLAESMEKTAVSIEALTALSDTASSDSKLALETIAENIETLNVDGLKGITNGLTSVENEFRMSLSDIRSATDDSFDALTTAIRQALQSVIDRHTNFLQGIFIWYYRWRQWYSCCNGFTQNNFGTRERCFRNWLSRNGSRIG